MRAPMLPRTGRIFTQSKTPGACAPGVRQCPSRAKELLHFDRDLVHLERLGGLAALGAGRLERLQHVHALDHFAEDGVLAVEPRSRLEREEELAAVGARS